MSETAQLPANISRCWQNNGYHAYMTGPCFDTRAAAVAYRDRLDAAGVTWWPQDRLSSLPPVPEEQP